MPALLAHNDGVTRCPGFNGSWNSRPSKISLLYPPKNLEIFLRDFLSETHYMGKANTSLLLSQT